MFRGRHGLPYHNSHRLVLNLKSQPAEEKLTYEKIDEIAKKYNLNIANFGHAGDGNLHPTCLTDERDTDEIKRVEKAFNDIYDETLKLGGTITGEHGVGLAKKGFLEKMIDVPALDIMHKIKAAFDPNNVLNPGKIISHSPKCEGKLIV